MLKYFTNLTTELKCHAFLQIKLQSLLNEKSTMLLNFHVYVQQFKSDIDEDHHSLV